MSISICIDPSIYPSVSIYEISFSLSLSIYIYTYIYIGYARAALDLSPGRATVDSPQQLILGHDIPMIYT